MKFTDVTDEAFEAWRDGMFAGYEVCAPGIYPASFNGVKRTSKQDGWNDACDSFLKNIGVVLGQMEENLAFWKMGFYLIEQDVAYMRARKNESLELCIRCSDTFYYACSDSEDVPESECEKVVNVYDEFGDDGLTAWVAVHRNEDPLERYQTDTFFKAKEFLLTTS